MTEKSQHRIQKLQKQVAEHITSQQIIPTLHECIKELIDNAIDAAATIIKIQLKQYGKLTFSVFDNGTGIKQVEKLGQGGNTSKLFNHSNFLEDIRTLGFRGQAVNSIANLCKEMTIHTVFKDENIDEKQNTNPKFIQATFSVTKRTLIDKKPSFSATNTFTKITVQSLFYNIPVRKYQLQNKPKQNLKKVYELLFQISLVFPQITFILINSVEGKQQLLFEAQKYYNRNVKKQQSSVDNQNFFQKDLLKQAWKQRIELCFPQKLDDCLVFIKSKNVEGFILNTIESGSSRKNLKFPKNLQYTFINRRPVNPLKQVCKIFDGYYKKYNPYTKYVFFLNIKCEPNEIDVNLSPNKRDILIKRQRMDDILRQIRQQIQKQVVEKVTNLGEYKQAKLRKSEIQSEKKGIKKQQQQDNQQHQRQDNQQQQKSNLSRPIFDKPKKSSQSRNDDSIKIRQQVFISNAGQNRQQKLMQGNYLANYGVLKSQVNSSAIQQLNRRISNSTFGIQSKIGLIAQNKNSKKIRTILQTQQKQEIPQLQRQVNSQSQENDQAVEKQQDNYQNVQKQRQKIQLNKNNNIMPLKINEQMKSKIYNSIKLSFQSKKQQNILENKVIKVENLQLRQDQSQIKKQSPYQNLNHKPEYHRNFKLQHETINQQQHLNCCHHQNTQSNNNFESTQKPILQEQIQDVKIQNFQVPDNINFVTENNRGQITKKDFKNFHIHGQFNKGFILCSFKEKNYLYIIDQHASEEKRLFESYMESKPQFYYLSKKVQLTPIQVDQIQMARQQLLKSGFTFLIENRTTLKIMRCPSHFKKNFGLQEFMQIAETNKNITEIPSFYNSAASKACRTAVMIGDQLGKNKMIDIVHRMSDLKSPWNCPHGRPSLISLGSFQTIIKKIKAPKLTYKF